MKNFLFLKRFLRPRKAKMIPINSGIFKGQKAYRTFRMKSTIDETCPFFVAKEEAVTRMMKECPIPEEVFRRAAGIK